MLFLVRPCASADREPSRTYYQVLDISPDEQDPKVIEEAALRCSSHVRAYQLTRESECTLRLNEIARALITVLDPVRRREYDLGLGKPLGPAPSERRPPDRRDTLALPRDTLAPSAPGEKAVAELVKNMSGLQFAPATPGSERAYKDLYERLVAYYNRAQSPARGE